MKRFLIAVALLFCVGAANAIPVDIDFEVNIDRQRSFSRYYDRTYEIPHSPVEVSIRFDTDNIVGAGYIWPLQIFETTGLSRNINLPVIQSDLSVSRHPATQGMYSRAVFTDNHRAGGCGRFSCSSSSDFVSLVGPGLIDADTDIIKRLTFLEDSNAIWRFAHTRSSYSSWSGNSGTTKYGIGRIANLDYEGKPVSVPEPASIVLMALGLIGISAAYRFSA